MSFSGLFGLAGWILFSVGSIERDLLICSVVLVVGVVDGSKVGEITLSFGCLSFTPVHSFTISFFSPYPLSQNFYTLCVILFEREGVPHM